MITFAFEPRAEDVAWSPDWLAENRERPDHPELTGADFSASFFLANVHCVIHGVDLSLRTPGLTVVDVALLLEYARRQLKTASCVAVETTLTQHVFSFSREAETVTLTTNYAPAAAELTWLELRQLADRAKAEAYRLITAAHPELRENEWLRDTVGSSPTA
ncbi:hypothetical protein [Streptomyces bauhiniae]|uniref:hypothetical protein n=1 Tax=Streptomyces bauhiniae TaxID=2340725 RepID=UPI0035E1CB5A